MIADDALASAYVIIREMLIADGYCGERCYPEFIPAGVVRPYYTWFLAAGGEANEIKRPDALLTITVKCVAETLAASLEGAGRISQGFNDQGGQETGTTLAAGRWHVLTITQGRRVNVIDMISDDARQLYHNGHQFDFNMERV